MSAIGEFLPLTETIAPADEAAVAEVVRDACRGGTAVYPIGGGTGLDYGVCPSRPGVGLSLERLNRVIDHAAKDVTITVQAGVTMADLGEQLATQGQRLPVDVPNAARATIGGVVATNAAGPRRYAHGTMRDHVVGIRAVDGRGTAFSSGGRVVKNAAGYNLCRLLVGSLGTLGVITQVTLMVRPVPETSALLACDLPSFEVAERLLAALVHTRTLPAAIELQAGLARQDMPRLALEPTSPSNVARLVVGFEGSEAEVAWMVGQLGDEWRESGVAPVQTIRGGDAGIVWGSLTEFPAEVQIGVRPSAAVGMIERLLRLDPGCAVLAHAGNGVVCVQLAPHEPDDFVATVRRKFRPAVAEIGGKMAVLSCPQDAKLTAEDVWGPPGDGAAVGRAIKDRFDPHRVLNPGRMMNDE